MALGGARPGAGRPKGSGNRRLISNYFTEKEVKGLLVHVKRQMLRDNKLALAIVEQLFGKAHQRLEMTGKDGEAIVVMLSSQSAGKYGINASPGGGNQ